MPEIDWKTEVAEMIESSCAYDKIDPKLQKIIVDTYNRTLKVYINFGPRSAKTETRDVFSEILNRNEIHQTNTPKETPNGFVLVKDPRYGWGPNNSKYYLLIPEELAFKSKVLGYLT